MKRLLAIVLCCSMLLCSAAFAADTTVRLKNPVGICYIGATRYVADYGSNAILTQNSDGEYVPLAGAINTADIYGKPAGGYYDSGLLEAQFNCPWDVISFNDGIVVSDSGNNALRYIADGKVSTLAGGLAAGLKNGTGTDAQFSCPKGLATDGSTLYVADTLNNCIRAVDKDGKVTTFAGTGAEGNADGAASQATFNSPTGICWYEGVLYIADTDNNCIRKIKDGQVTTVAGGNSGVYEDSSVLAGGYADGWCENALFRSPMDVGVNEFGIYVADTGNSAVRMIEDDWVRTILNDSDFSTCRQPAGLCLSNGSVYSTDRFSAAVFCGDGYQTSSSFGDVSGTSWASEYVTFAVANRLFKGVSVNSFAPDATMTRGMIAAVIGRTAQIPNRDLILSGSKTFSDVPADAYYAAELSWAAERAVISGTGDGDFSPSAAATRQETVTMLFRLAGAMELDTGKSADISAFTDAAAVAAWAQPAMRWAVAEGIISGNENKQLMPADQLTRAQAAKLFSEFAKLK